jgi:hypothetical protein
LVIAAYFLIFYPAVMKKEEVELHQRYGTAFDEYAARVPLFWPRPPRRPGAAVAGNGEASFSWKQYQRNREYQAAIGVLGALLLVCLRMIVRHRTGW